MRALRRGKRELAPAEATEVAAKLQALHAAAHQHGWLSAEHREARRQLSMRLAALAATGVPHSRLAAALGVHKSRVGQLIGDGR